VGPSLGRAADVTSRAGDERDFDALCRREHRRLVGMLGLYCGDVDLAEELTQEALARLCRRWATLPSDDDASRWLTRVALNLAKSSFRTRATRRRILDRYGASLVSTSRADREDVDVRALAVRRAVAALPDRQRRAIILRYFCDLPIAEVAVLMPCAEGTVKSLTSQAVARLRSSGLEFNDA
jgi:RNA polymerase sigma factor (sigma-70 family)